MGMENALVANSLKINLLELLRNQSESPPIL